MKKKILLPFAVLLVLVLLCMATLLSGTAFSIDANLVHMVNFSNIAVTLALSAVLSFAFGFVRFDRASALALGTVVIHDALLAFSLVALLTIPVEGMLALPALKTLELSLMLVPFFTFVQSFPVISLARKAYLEMSRKELSAAGAGRYGANKTLALRVLFFFASLFLLVGIAVIGAGKAVIVPVVASVVSFYSASILLPGLFANTLYTMKSSSRR